MKGNKGEWSELYALVYLLGTRKLYAADEKLQKLKELYFPMMIDSKMENIIAEMLLYSYREDEKDCSRLINSLEESNPLNYPRKNFYVYKFKKFLCAKALGLEPSKEWNGIDEANGGYIVVKLNGDVVAYHLYNRDKFEQYLYDSTCLERASTSRHGYASLYVDSDSKKMYIKLNLQIRFKKVA